MPSREFARSVVLAIDHQDEWIVAKTAAAIEQYFSPLGRDYPHADR
jgi:hypothetical protein